VRMCMRVHVCVCACGCKSECVCRGEGEEERGEHGRGKVLNAPGCSTVELLPGRRGCADATALQRGQLRGEVQEGLGEALADNLLVHMLARCPGHHTAWEHAQVLHQQLGEGRYSPLVCLTY